MSCVQPQQAAQHQLTLPALHGCGAAAHSTAAGITSLGTDASIHTGYKSPNKPQIGGCYGPRVGRETEGAGISAVLGEMQAVFARLVAHPWVQPSSSSSPSKHKGEQLHPSSCSAPSFSIISPARVANARIT